MHAEYRDGPPLSLARDHPYPDPDAGFEALFPPTSETPVLHALPFDWVYLLLPLVGLAAGVVGGLLGIGGGVVMIPALVVVLGDERYGMNTFHTYKLAAIATSMVVSIPAVMRHARAQVIVWRIIPPVLAGATGGIVAGVALASTLVGEYTALLRRIFGAFLELVVLLSIWEQQRREHSEHLAVTSCPLPSRALLYAALVGAPAGVLGGLLGVGGGVWAAPVQRQVLGIRLRSAIANSAAMIIGVSAISSILLTITASQMPPPAIPPWRGWMIAGLLSPGAVAGGWLGADLTHRLPLGWVRAVFLVVLAVVGARLMVS